MNRKLVTITLIVLVLFIIAFLALQKAQRIELPPAVSIDTTDQPSVGTGKITMVTFEDMKCSNCKRYDMEIYPYIKEHYIDTQRARYVMIPLAFLNNSMPAGNAALCVYHQNAALFFDYVNTLYQHQPNEALDWATPEVLTQFAQQVPNINLKDFIACVNNHTYYKQLQKNLKLASTVMGDTVKTPTLYINGYLVNPLTTVQINRMILASQ